MGKSRKKNKPPRRPIKGSFIFAMGLLIGGGGMWWNKAEPQEREKAVTTASNYWEVAETKAGEWIEDIRTRLNFADRNRIDPGFQVEADEPVNKFSAETATRGREATDLRSREDDRYYAYARIPKATSYPHEVNVLTNSAYLVGYSSLHENPLWVAHRLFEVERPGLIESLDALRTQR